ncbi:MAG TPA: MBL fold metallo-hydrolase [Nitrososphaeraceae archaeon]|nr:MBL fold metallo-hydrolase [Nitrososphaeraceae archaeon]
MDNISNSSSNNRLQNVVVRINGVLPDNSSLGTAERSERAAEVKQQNITSNTSCSLISVSDTNQIIFHMLIDVGQGVVESVKNGIPSLGFTSTATASSTLSIPDAVLITHSHDDHIKELPILIEKANTHLKNLRIFCTPECYDQIIKKFPQISSSSHSSFSSRVGSDSGRISFSMVKPDEIFEIGPFSVRPVLAHHGTDSPPGSVCYIVTICDNKIIIGWDFLSLPTTSEDLLWNPDLLILGTETYNAHPETGMVSVIEAFDIVRRWNAKECYIVHYSGLRDFEEAKNQWFRGPIKAMTTEELQKTIDSHLRLTGSGGKFKIKVATEGTVWSSKDKDQEQKLSEQNFNTNAPIGKVLSIESLQKYVLLIERDTKNDKLKLMIEDRVNRYDLAFDKPRKDNNNENIVYAQGEKGMMARGPQLKLEVVDMNEPSYDNSSTIRVNVSKGKKTIFIDDILIDKIDAIKFRKYIKENF